MKISNSQVAMSTSHQESSYTYRESMTISAKASNDYVGAILSLSKEASEQNYMESMKTFQKNQEEAKKQKGNTDMNQLQNMLERLKTNADQYEVPKDIDAKIKMLRQILAALRGKKIPEDCKFKRDDGITDLRSGKYRAMDTVSGGFKLSAAVSTGITVSASEVTALTTGTTGSGTLWQNITASSGFHVESEATTFASAGIVKTQDGREIEFNIEFSMTRAFMENINTLEVEEYIKTDPLIINLDSNVTSVSDQKFLFDLDSDGEKERISFAGEGSGFLAYDKNGDGIINDGSELFGTKSGDGFKDLAAYDEDGNGWIDENDSIFNKLKIWTKDSDGHDILLNLKKADVGAICLQSADTQFSLKNEENKLNAEIKKTGVYLKESTGLAGTIAHVDLAV